MPYVTLKHVNDRFRDLRGASFFVDLCAIVVDWKPGGPRKSRGTGEGSGPEHPPNG